MKVTIKDPDALRNIPKDALVEYLERTGWEHTQDFLDEDKNVIGEEWKYFANEMHRTFYVTVLPNGDNRYTAKMAETFMSIEQATDHSQLQIYADIMNDAVVFLPTDLSNFEINLDMSQFSSPEVEIGDEDSIVS